MHCIQTGARAGMRVNTRLGRHWTLAHIFIAIKCYETLLCESVNSNSNGNELQQLCCCWSGQYWVCTFPLCPLVIVVYFSIVWKRYGKREGPSLTLRFNFRPSINLKLRLADLSWIVELVFEDLSFNADVCFVVLYRPIGHPIARWYLHKNEWQITYDTLTYICLSIKFLEINWIALTANVNALYL